MLITKERQSQKTVMLLLKINVKSRMEKPIKKVDIWLLGVRDIGTQRYRKGKI